MVVPQMSIDVKQLERVFQPNGYVMVKLIARVVLQMKNNAKVIDTNYSVLSDEVVCNGSKIY